MMSPNKLSLGEMMNALNHYYDAEKSFLPFAISFGVIAVVLGILLIWRGAMFWKGFGWPLVLIGLIFSIGSATYSSNVQARKENHSALLASKPAAYKEVESKNLEKLQRNFKITIAVNLALALVGLALCFFGRTQQKLFLSGFGMSLAIVFSIQAILENHNRNRAAAYGSKLYLFDPEQK